MNKIIAKRSISEGLVKLEIKTSTARSDFKPGQYIILRSDKNAPGISVPVLKVDNDREILTVLIEAIDNNTQKLAALNAGSEISEVDGPYGEPARIENFGMVMCIAREQGILSLLPVLSSLRKAGNHVVTVLSAQTKAGIILENEVEAVSDEVLLLTDDGSCGEKEQICHAMGKKLKYARFDQVFVHGSARAIKEVCAVTTKYNIPSQAVLLLGNTCGNQVHGIFKVSICGNAKLICVDGLNFNAYYPNFDEMVKRFGSREQEITTRTKALTEQGIPV